MSSSLIKTGFMAACVTFSLSSTTGFAKEYYKWVDAKGSTHYTSTPPPKSAKKKGKVDTYGATHSSTPRQPAPEKINSIEQPNQNTTIVSGEKVIVLPVPTAAPVNQAQPDNNTLSPEAR
ncbi:hypothetical protein AY606_05175 [Acinetobacter sp. SFB]|uniref:DUF4124 domain-containing protein n=1 Tax=Acinetobacter sp. SFB TaxID=1805634 RepID=UPI0007D8047C|nr:DUF4124 domain-containing protein [Acinetobacter sp. SFB]OAL80033.1 hypothetical protein AY606_05175 [Acinetobacter sp. SFB]